MYLAAFHTTFISRARRDITAAPIRTITAMEIRVIMIDVRNVPFRECICKFSMPGVIVEHTQKCKDRMV